MTNIATRRRGSSNKYFVNIKECGDPKPAYDGELPIKLTKYNDLQFLCRTNVIPPQYHSFYKNLKVSDKNNTAEDEDDEDELMIMRTKSRTCKKK